MSTSYCKCYIKHWWDEIKIKIYFSSFVLDNPQDIYYFQLTNNTITVILSSYCFVEDMSTHSHNLVLHLHKVSELTIDNFCLE